MKSPTRRALLLAAMAALLPAAILAAEPAANAPAGPPDDEQLQEFVAKHISDWWPTAEEKRFDEIGWAADLREARRLAREHDRPIFLFTMDGRVNTGRC
jgi:hypothetical protein